MEREDKLKNRMLRLILPIAFQQFMLALVSACDVVMLGRLSQEAMSAVSLASQVTFVFNLFMAAFVIGENMFLAQYYGKKDYEGISGVFRLVLGISAATAALFLAGSLLIPETIMRILTSEPELVRLGSVYLRYVGVSWLLSAVSQVYLAYMKNCGAVKPGTLISSATVVLNIFLNAVLIFGLFGFPALGIPGAALATVLSTAVQALCRIGHPKHRTDGMYSFPITIGDNVWIGANVIVLPGVTIGENSVIGAGSVVTKDIPANVVAFGSLCKVYREINERDEVYYFKDRRFDDQPE